MILIEVLKGCAGDRFSFSRGKRYEVSNDLGLDLINAGFAREVTREKPVAQTPEIVKAVVQEPIQIVKAETTENTYTTTTGNKRKRK